MAADSFVGPKVEFEPGGDVIRIKSGGSLVVDSGGSLTGTRIQRDMVSVEIPLATALSTVVPDRVILNTELPITVKSIRAMYEAGIAGHATSNTVINVKLISALATATTAVASLTFTTSNAVTAYIPKTLTLTTSVAVAAGESLVQSYTFASSGLNVGVGQLTLEYNTDAT